MDVRPDDPFSPDNAGGVVRPAIDRAAIDVLVSEPFRPTVLPISNEATQLRFDAANLARLISIPSDMELLANAVGGREKLRLSEPFARRFRRFFWYIGEIHLSKEVRGASSRGSFSLGAYESRCVVRELPPLILFLLSRLYQSHVFFHASFLGECHRRPPHSYR